MIDYEKLHKSLKNLELQVDNYNRAADRKELSDLDREALAESVIHRFETCYDMLWKHLKRYIVEELGLVDVPNSPKPVFRFAAENNLLANAVEQWLNYADARTATAHDYSGKKAADCLDVIP
ncbi:MAG: nucleotidyltransferase substrate binding protein, partial [Deltaproteobacteria bacterium]|nr:nucleotidyltransferase substrate binding protein [Deltaproteobacteria bacterium]